MMLARVLRGGVFLAASVVGCGAAVFLAHRAYERPQYDVFKGELASLRSIGDIMSGVGQLDGRALIQFGLVLLIATPIARVVLAALGFLRQRDWTYVAITLAVLGLLGYSLFLG